MIATDTSSLAAYFGGEPGADTARVDSALASGELCLPPVVIAEILSSPATRGTLEPIIATWPALEITTGYWARAGATRARLIARSLRARLPDALIAQSCIDHGVPLITRDTDFRHFAKHCGLKLA